MVIGSKEIQEEENWEHFPSCNLSIHVVTLAYTQNVKEALMQKGTGDPIVQNSHICFLLPKTSKL